MTLNEMRDLLDALLDREPSPFDVPSSDDWDALGEKFGCSFNIDFRNFISLMATHSFPGEVYCVSSGRTNGNGSIQLVYDLEIASNPFWDRNMIPFYGIGNGDYFCLDKMECPESRVHYYYHERGRTEAYSLSIENWLKELPEFLSGS